ILVEVHAEQDGVVATGRHAAVLMASAASDDQLVVGPGKPDGCRNVIAIHSWIGDKIRTHGSARPLLLGIRGKCVLGALRIILGVLWREYFAAKSGDRTSSNG